MAFAAGLLALILAAGVSGALSAEQLGRIALPGCGLESACASLAASEWGRLPGLDWPLSFVGTAWFLGLLAAWSVTRARLPRPLLAGVRVGILASLGLIGVMIALQKLCAYCLAAHVAHLVFWIAAEHTARRQDAERAASGSAWLAFALTAAVSTAGLGLWEARTTKEVADRQEAALAESTEKIARTLETESQARTQEEPAGETQAETSAPRQARHRIGPERARVRIVVFSDYACEDCKRVHVDLERVTEQHDDVSLSAMHFPMCAECNPRFADRDLHPTACEAARAAEAVGMVGGAQAFWDFSRWLFSKDGRFTRAELQDQVRSLGLDVAAFTTTMESPEVAARIEGDIEEALRLGLHFTPMVFLNGIELEGVLAHQAVSRAVSGLLASAPEAASGAADVPQTALEKYLSDWRRQPRRNPGPGRHLLGASPEGARLQIVVWGDYEERHTKTADEILRSWAQTHPEVSYTFRHFPAHSGCNSKMGRVMHPKACLLAQAVEAAAQLGDAAQYELMHSWVFENRERATQADILRTAAQLGFDPVAFEAAMKSEDVARTIDRDAQEGFPFLYHGTIPAIYIDGRVVPRWRLDGHNVLAAILAELD